MITVKLTNATFGDGRTVKDFAATGAPESVRIAGIVANAGSVATPNPVVATYLTATETARLEVLPIEAGGLYAWGYNAEGQLGDGAGSGHRAGPVKWAGSEKYTSVTGGWASLAAVTTAGTVFATGNNFCGPFGNGKMEGNSFTGPVGPALRADGNGPFTKAARAVSMHGSFDTTVWMVGTDGRYYAAGENAADMFSLNDGTQAGESEAAHAYGGFVPVGTEILKANPGTSIVNVSCAGWYRAVYLLSNGTVWNSGANNYYAMGNNGASGKQYLAAQTVKADGAPLTNIVAAVTSQDAAMYLDRSGNLWGAGTNSHGQLPGLGTSTSAVAKTAVPLTQPNGKKVSRIWASGADSDSFVAETTDGALYITGANVDGSGSTGSATSSPFTWTRMIVAAGKSVADIAFGYNGAVYRMTDGTVYFAGLNDTAGTGKGVYDSTQVTTMVQVPLPGKAIDIAATWYDTYAAVVV